MSVIVIKDVPTDDNSPLFNAIEATSPVIGDVSFESLRRAFTISTLLCAAIAMALADALSCS